jgi:hypothetical protein
MSESEPERLDEAAAAWREIDPQGEVRYRRRENGQFEFIVVSSLFEGLDSGEREALFWPSLRNLPDSLLVRMSYSLLLSSDEAARLFADHAPNET